MTFSGSIEKLARKFDAPIARDLVTISPRYANANLAAGLLFTKAEIEELNYLAHEVVRPGAEFG
jgi:hypothetical protein